MDPELRLVLEEDADRGMRLVAASSGHQCGLTRFCGDEQELDAEVRSLHEELDRVAGHGRERLAEMRERAERSDPVQLWQEMEALSDEEQMVSYFNALPRTIRSKVAEHVLTRISAFKGRAPQFAGRYNSDTNLLE
jgi:hypothetical protein